MGVSGGRWNLALLSSGLDSYIMWVMAGHPPALFLADNSAPNFEQERRRIVGLCSEWGADSIKIMVTRRLAIWREDGGFVPYRNLWFILEASLDNPGPLRLLIGQTLEWQVDKHPGFYRSVRKLARDLGRRDLVIEAPLARMTKTQAVKAFLAYMGPAGRNQLATWTYSCQTGRDVHCGRCSSCMQRYIALKNNRLDVGLPGQAQFEFEHIPTWDEYLENAKDQLRLFRWQNFGMYLRRGFEAIDALEGK